MKMFKELFLSLVLFIWFTAADRTTKSYPSSCGEAVRIVAGSSGVYQIEIPNYEKPFFVYCQVDNGTGDAWTLFQRRLDGTIDFYQNWEEYKMGFGNLLGEFFIGLDKLHALTQNGLHELRIEFEDFDKGKRHANYAGFAIGDETQKYALNILGNYTGNSGDSLTHHQGRKFSTKDNSHTTHSNCAVDFTGAWWYSDPCHKSNLNGQYLKGEYPQDKFAKGACWEAWRGYYYSYKYVHMAIRPIKKLK